MLKAKMDFRISIKTTRVFGIILFVSALALNKFVAERIISSDGKIESPTVNGFIILGQCLLAGAGLVVYVRRPSLEVSRRSIGILLVVLFTLQSTFRTALPKVGYLESILKTGYQRVDEVTVYESRFNCIRNELPTTGIIGYTTSSQIRADWATFYHHYYLTQYSLAPLVVEDSTKTKLVVANYPNSAFDNTPKEVDTCGNGIALLPGASQ